MKKISFLAVLAVMFSLSAGVVKGGESKTVNGRFIGGVGLGAGLPMAGFGSAYNGGGGIDGYVGFSINSNLALLLAVDSFLFRTTDPNVYSVEVNFAPSLKYVFGEGDVRFYLMGGLGLNSNMLYAESGSATTTVIQRNFMVEPGAGIQIFLDDALNLYIQSKYIEVFAPSTLSYLPISIGLDFK